MEQVSRAEAESVTVDNASAQSRVFGCSLAAAPTGGHTPPVLAGCHVAAAARPNGLLI